MCAEFGIPEHVDEVVELARRCLESPTVKRAIESGSYMREVPISTATEDGFTIGRADLVFRDGEELVVVDYKTDSVLPEHVRDHTEEHHAAQTEAYAAAIGTATDGTVRLVLVYCRPGSEVAI